MADIGLGRQPFDRGCNVPALKIQLHSDENNRDNARAEFRSAAASVSISCHGPAQPCYRYLIEIAGPAVRCLTYDALAKM